MSKKNGIVIKKKHIVIGAIIILLLLIGMLVVGLNWNNWFNAAGPDNPSSSQSRHQLGQYQPKLCTRLSATVLKRRGLTQVRGSVEAMLCG